MLMFFVLICVVRGFVSNSMAHFLYLYFNALQMFSTLTFKCFDVLKGDFGNERYFCDWKMVLSYFWFSFLFFKPTNSPTSC